MSLSQGVAVTVWQQWVSEG